MKLQAIDALTGLRAALEAPADQRLDVFRARVMNPLRPFWEPFLSRVVGGPATEQSDPAMQAARAFGYFSPDFDADQGLAALDRLERARTWQACVDAVEKAWHALDPYAHGIALDGILFTLVLGTPKESDDLAGSYTGFGARPGLVMVMGWPTVFSLPRLPAAVAHELHHNVRFSFEPFRMDQTTVGQYIVAEGLAEAFAAELFGEDKLGPWAQALSEDQVVALKPRFREALETTGFDEIRGYVFGDWAPVKFGYRPQGLPDFAGYTMGYRVVWAYLEQTGKTAAEATYVPWREIVAESRLF